jgi:hypothetical protein
MLYVTKMEETNVYLAESKVTSFSDINTGHDESMCN